MKFTKLISISKLLLVIFLVNCGAIEPKDSGEDGENSEDAVPSKDFYGIWEGDFKDQRDGASTTLISVELKLNTDNSFTMKSIEDSSAIAKGEFTKYATSMVFKAETSSISLFALHGESQDYEFSLVGKNLELFNKNSLIRLKLKESFESSDETIDDTAENQYIGKWRGLDKNRITWLLTINDGKTFSSKLSKSTQLPVTLGGTYQSNKEGLLMEISEADAPEITGNYLKITLLSEKEIQVSVLDENNNNVQTFSLRKL